MNRIRVLMLMAVSLLYAWPAVAAPLYTFESATFVRCIDGDTCEFDLHEKHAILERVTYHARIIRFADVDTPESYRPRCEAEGIAGEKARVRVEGLLQAAKRIDIQIMMKGKYGRLIAHVVADGRDVSQLLISEGLGRPYSGGKRESWC
jgi:endonuclease YncB( thermonuclease family)